MDLYEYFAQNLPAERLRRDEPMSAHTSFRIGGPAEVMFLPENESEVARAAMLAREAGCGVTFIGRGSNLLVRDGGIAGLVIAFAEAYSGIAVQGNILRARAGDTLTHLANAALEAGLTGLEFASGIPGSVGGGMAMNAGAYGGELKDVAVSARLMDMASGEIKQLDADELEMGYRTSRALRTGQLVLEATFELRIGDKSEIKAKMDELNARRREKQPLNYPSAGSTFKRPEGFFAGALIEQAGLKGLRVGGAQVSTKHAGFIVNTGGASAGDVEALIGLVTEKVFAQSGVRLEPEVRIVGENGGFSSFRSGRPKAGR